MANPYTSTKAKIEAELSAAGREDGSLSKQDRAAISSAVSLIPQQKPAQPPSEPAVISSESINELNEQNKTKLDQYSKKGSTVGEDGNAYGADGAMLAAPEGAQWDEASGQWKYGGKTYGVTEFYEDDDEDYKAVQRLFDPLRESLDKATLGQINAIHQQFDSLRGEQREFNKQAENARSRSLLLGGSSRYAPLNAASTMLAQTSYGLRQIQSLDAKENMAIAQARAAQEEGNFRLMDKALTMAESVRKEKQTAAADVMKGIQEANQKLAERRDLVMRDEQVADIMAGGVTDPAGVLKAMKDAGHTITAKEVNDVIKDLVPEGASIYKFSNSDVGKMLGAGMNALQIQATQDYYNGKGEAPALTAAQQAVINTTLNGKSPAGSASESSYNFTKDQVSQLLSGNFTQSDIAAMETDIAKYGIDAVVDGMSEEQKKLVKRVLAKSDSVAGTAAGENTELTREKLAEIYGIEDNNEYGEDTNGWWPGGKEKNSDVLDQLEAMVARYKDFYSDKEILKMIEDSSDE